VDVDGTAAHATAAAAVCIAGEEKRGVNCCARFLGGIVLSRFGVGGPGARLCGWR
jgi:hypothetical protein